MIEYRLITCNTRSFIAPLGMAGPISRPMKIEKASIISMMMSGLKVFETHPVTKETIELTLGNIDDPNRFPSVLERNNLANKRVKVAEKVEVSNKKGSVASAESFNRYEINFTPRELTAMIIHEIGHTVYSEKFLSMMYNAYKEAQMRLTLADKASLKVLYSLYMIPMSIGCMQKNFFSGKNEINVEYYADNLLHNYGYAEDLVSALEKIIKYYGNGVSSTNNLTKKTIDESMQWATINIKDLVRRKDKLKDEIFYRSLRSESGFFKSICLKVLHTLGVKMRERYSGAVVECTIDMLTQDNRYGKDLVPVFEYYEPFYDFKAYGDLSSRINIMKKNASRDRVAMELFFFKKKKELPTQQDIDEIAMEIENISNERDRMYVMDMLYEVIEAIDVYEENNYNSDKFKKVYAPRIDSMRKSIDSVKKKVMDKKIPGRTTKKRLVNYPVGYEG